MNVDYLLKFYWPHGRVEVGELELSDESPDNPGLTFRCIATVLIVLFAILSTASIRATVKLADQRNVIFDRLGTADGLSQAVVTAITQDTNGFVWIGTQEGLNRFDGYHFETFLHSENVAGTISHHFIRSLLSDSKGILWVGTDSGLNRYNEVDKTFDVFYLNSESHTGGLENAVYSLVEDSKQRMWIGTEIGLTVRSPSGLFTHYHYNDKDPDSIGPGSVRAIYEDEEKSLWVGTCLLYTSPSPRDS